MTSVRFGNVTVEVDDQGLLASIHRHGRHDRIVGSLSIPLDEAENLVRALTAIAKPRG